METLTAVFKGLVMFLHRRFLISICIFISAVILCGVVEVAFGMKHFFNCITQLVCISLLVFWINSIRKRITENTTRRLLLACGFLLLSYFVFEIIKYRFINENIIWYFYYIPMAVVPLLAFYVAYEIYGKHLERRKVIYPLFALVSAAILILVLTNDLHNLAFKFTEGNSYTYGPVYFAHIIWSLVLLVGLLYFSIKGFYVSHNRKFGFILILPVAFDLLYTLLYATGNNPEIFGCHIWSTGTVFSITCVGVLEMCIQLGLIPSNSGYEKIYSAISIPSAIFERSGVQVFSSACFEKIAPEDKNFRITNSRICGGFVKTAIDISSFNELNEKLSVVSGQMRMRNNHLLFENRTREEKAETEERSRIYDRVSLAVKPQLEKIQSLLEKDFDKNIGEIALLNAYIKRRCNMELLSEKGELQASELFNALTESSEYIKLSGVNTIFTCNGEAAFPAQMIVGIYGWFESIIEGCFESLDAIAIYVNVSGEMLLLRLMISAENFQFTTMPEGFGLEKYMEKSQITKEGDDIIFTMHLKYGGAK